MSILRIASALRRRSLGELLGFALILTRNALGLPNRLRTPDRTMLEQTLLPALAASPGCRRVLFVGCEWFTRHYEALFPAADEYWTVDPDPWKRRFGARRHLVAGLEALDSSVPADYFDLIVCNGVFGWGLDERAACEQAFANCYSALREGGFLLLGYNDVPARRPFDPTTLAALGLFLPAQLPGVGVPRHVADASNGHTFCGYLKPGSSAGPRGHNSNSG